MTSVHNYTFNQLNRLGDDTCGITQRDVENNAQGSYMTTNYFLKWCGMKQPISFATEQPWYFLHGWVWKLLGSWRLQYPGRF